MTQKVVDQHALLARWREIADELAEALGHLNHSPWHEQYQVDAEAALRRYEEASKS